MHRLATAALVAACSAFSRADAVTLDQALVLARERAPRILSARERIEEARGRLAGATPLLRENPQVEAAAGRRYSDDDGDTTSAEAGVRQAFEIGGQRGARIEGARARIASAGAAEGDARRRLLREVAVAFYGALHAQECVRLGENSEGVADEVAHIAERRYRAEDVPVLDLNVSRAALARARADRQVAQATLVGALGGLRVLLGMDASEALTVEGALGPRGLDAVDLLARAPERADLRALAARVAEADAEQALARGEAWPDLGLGARYERDERDDVVLGEVSLEIPVFDRAQGRRAETSARARRLRIKLDAARRVAGVELQTALAVHAERAKAAFELEANALPLLDENESLARRSYEAGEIALAELLLVRRETLDTRRQYLDRLLDAAVAAVDAESSAGALE